MKIYYCGHPHDCASGGMVVQLRHVKALRNLGYEAYFVVPPGYDPSWIDLKDFPVLFAHLDEVESSGSDVLVVPECAVDSTERWEGRKVALVQNWSQVKQASDVFYAKKYCRGLGDGQTYKTLGYSFAICTSAALRDIITKITEIDVPVVTVTDYVEIPSVTTRQRVSKRVFTAALNSQGLDVLVPLVLSYVHGVVPDFSLRIAPAMSREEFICELLEADVYLHSKYPEGMPLRPLEAMLCRAAVVGFSGGGGLEYMEHGVTALVAEDGNFGELARHVRTVVEDNELRERLRIQGHEVARKYTFDRFLQELRSCFECLLS